MLSKTIISAIFALSLISTPQLAFAESAGNAPDEHALANLSAVSPEALGDVSGGTAIVASSANIASTADGNYIDTIGKTGEIANNSLNSNSGITTLIANSGNQVSISQATSISIYMH